MFAGGTPRRMPAAQPAPVQKKEAGKATKKREAVPIPPPQPVEEAAEPAVAAAPVAVAQEERVTVGDFLVDSLTAQSLDLPPQAAKVSCSSPLMIIRCTTVFPRTPPAHT